jgi:hypothetical protein
MKTEIQVMHGIPDADVNSTVTLLMADPRYISHTVTPEGGGKNAIEVTLRVD